MIDFDAIPQGWFLYRLGECVKPINYRHDTHENTGEGFSCELQYRGDGGRLTKAKGATPAEAFNAAIAEVERQWPDFVP
jgi:hypothetical protein